MLRVQRLFRPHGIAVSEPDLLELQLGTILDLLAAVVLGLLEVQQQLHLAELLPQALHALPQLRRLLLQLCLSLRRPRLRLPLRALRLFLLEVGLRLHRPQHFLHRPNLAEQGLPEDFGLGRADILLEALDDGGEVEVEEGEGVLLPLLGHLPPLDLLEDLEDLLELRGVLEGDVLDVLLEGDLEDAVRLEVGVELVLCVVPLVEALVLEQRHEQLLLEELVVEVAQHLPVDHHAVPVRLLQEVVRRPQDHLELPAGRRLGGRGLRDGHRGLHLEGLVLHLLAVLLLFLFVGGAAVEADQLVARAVGEDGLVELPELLLGGRVFHFRSDFATVGFEPGPEGVLLPDGAVEGGEALAEPLHGCLLVAVLEVKAAPLEARDRLGARFFANEALVGIGVGLVLTVFEGELDDLVVQQFARRGLLHQVILQFGVYTAAESARSSL